VLTAADVAAEFDDDRLIDITELRTILPPVSDMTLWRWIRDPRVGMPAPIKLGADHRNFWRLSAIRAWIKRREEASAWPTARRGPKPGRRRAPEAAA
jgi:predicted DNA-binding transcriptional regulator AlpA